MHENLPIGKFPLAKFPIGKYTKLVSSHLGSLKGEAVNELINEKLGAWLLKEGHTQALLAEEIGISRPTLSGRLSGKSKWIWEEVLQISRITGASLDELAGFASKAVA